MKPLLLLALPVAALLTLGCMSDRDTLSDEYKHFPSTVQVIVGWFDRNPPLFYQMRLQRCEDLIRRGKASLDDYDDAGVAAIKLGKSKLALGFMNQKRALLERIDDPAKRQDDWYRYYANDGTFLVHDWYASPECSQSLRRPVVFCAIRDGRGVLGWSKFRLYKGGEPSSNRARVGPFLGYSSDFRLGLRLILAQRSIRMKWLASL